MFVCRFCSYETSRWDNFRLHWKYHRNLDNNHHCGYGGCKFFFKSEESLRKHLIECHNLKLPAVPESTIRQCSMDLNGHYSCDVLLCSDTFPHIASLIKHLKNHIREGVIIKCPMLSCDKEYGIVNSFDPHVSKYHRETHHNSHYESQVTKATSPIIADEQYESIDIVCDADFPDRHNTVSGDVDEDADNLFLNNVAIFLLKLEAQFTIPVSTIQYVVKELENITRDSQDIINQKLEIHLLNAGLHQSKIDEIIRDLAINNPFLCSLSELRTGHRRKKYFKDNKLYVTPIQILISEKNGHKYYFHYVPIENTLQSMFLIKSIQDYMDKNNCYPETNLLRDFYDGSVCLNNQFFRENPDALKIILYQDSFEIVNPLGSAKAKHKILAIYLSLCDLPSHARTHIDNMQLVALCKKKNFNHEKVYGPIVHDLKRLEDEGVNLNGGVRRRVGLAFIAGDNLGSHQLGGFVTNFSAAKYFCRYCIIKREQFIQCQSNCPDCIKGGKIHCYQL